MPAQLLTEKIWPAISQEVRKNPSTCLIAVAYFGALGTRLLPLRKGSILVVNASEAAVKSGQTKPGELLKLYNRGVKIFTVSTLHAKVFCFRRKVIIGSANASEHSAATLQEAAVQINNPKIVATTRKFIESLCFHELGGKRLRVLDKMYKPPRFENYAEKSLRKRKVDANNIRIVNLTIDVEPEDVEKTGIAGEREAKRFAKKPRHKIDKFRWTGSDPFSIGEQILQVATDGKTKWIYPPGTIIHKKSAQSSKEGKYTHLFIEAPNKRRRLLKSFQMKLSPIERKMISRAGHKNERFSKAIYTLWK